jgi:hypothetical protein
MPKLVARPVLFLLAAGVLGLAGCSTPESGNPSPSTTAPASSGGAPSSPASPTSSSSSGTAATSAVDPCSLLGVSDLAQYGTFSGPTPSNAAAARSCIFQRQLASASDKALGVSINVRDLQTIDSANDLGGGKQTGTVNGRKSVEVKGDAACVMVMAVGDNSRVDVSITADTTDEACTVAEKLSDVVEPKLPKS